MRRTLLRKLSRALPVAHYLQTVKPQTADWSNDLKALAAASVKDLGAWAALSPEAKAKINVSPSVSAALESTAAHVNAGTKRIAILYASQTGTAESYAKMMGTYAVSHGLEPHVMTMNDGIAALTSGPLPDAVVFVAATYGTGEFPSNAKQFWKQLSSAESNELQKVLPLVPHAIFGLGNSHNDSFNAAAKSLAARLKAVGSPSLIRTQLSCELQPNGHDTAFASWKRALWKALDANHTGERLVKPTYSVTQCLVARPDPHVTHAGYIPATVHVNAKLTPVGYTPRVRFMRMSMDCEAQRRAFGRVGNITDHISIYPVNGEDLVNRMLKRLGIDGDSVVEIAPLPGAQRSPYDFKKLEVRTVLSEVVDLSHIPTRSAFETLSLLATDPLERQKLEAIGSDLTSGGAFDKLVKGVVTFVDVFEMFPSIKATLALVLTILPHMAPRSYSIASDNTDGNHASFDILYNVPLRHADGRSHQGLCSGMLDRAQPGDKFMVHLQPSGIALPRDDAPCLIVALGTGIGSAHSILQHRYALAKSGAKVGKTHLFYGMRHADKDLFFREDFNAMEKAGFLSVTYVASHDGPKFVTPMDLFDRSLVDFLGKDGHVAYCGLGGSVPLVLERSLQRCGIDMTALRSEGRYHEEFFTVDADAENLFKDSTADANAQTLAGRMGKTDMFCFQCEQTFKGKGCHKVGVCGKTPRVAALQDLTINTLKCLSFYAHELRLLDPTAVSDTINRFTLYALFSTLTNVNFDEARFVKILGELQQLTREVKSSYTKLCASPRQPSAKELPTPLPHVDKLVELGREVTVLSRFTDPATQNAAGVSEMLVYGLKGIAAYADHSLMNRRELPEIYAFIHKALAFMTTPDQFDLGKGLALALEAGSINVKTMGLLYESNSSLGVPTPTKVPVKPRPGKAILVSGHDLVILKGLLERTEPLGIDVYTHGEMLPAHSYPKLHAHKNLAGHYGGAWMRQGVEFPHFPGPVLMTTNCLTEPHESYAARIFTAGAVGWSGIPHIGNNMDDINFDSLLQAAQESKGFGNEKEFNYADPIGLKRPDSLTVGFGHETILSVAPTIIEEIKKGNITRFFVVGGCDGYEGERSYYTDLVARLPKTAVVLTVGCGKFRFNHMDLGTIGNTGIPRILDMGQCNDSYSAVQVALALAKVLNCQVSDLPLSIVLSWFEQKAIAVLLSCLSLGLKPIHVGPALPAFVTPDVLNVLVKDFGLRPLGDVDEDLKTMLAASGAS